MHHSLFSLTERPPPSTQPSGEQLRLEKKTQDVLETIFRTENGRNAAENIDILTSSRLQEAPAEEDQAERRWHWMQEEPGFPFTYRSLKEINEG